MDKKIIFGQLGGLQFTQESLDFMQRSTETLHTLARTICTLEGCQYLIISGCETQGATVSAGVVIINGELLPFAGGAAKTYVQIEETRENAEFMDGQPKEVYVSRHVVFSTSGTEWSKFRGLTEKQDKAAEADGDLEGTFDALNIKEQAVTLAKLATEVANRLKYREFSALLHPTTTGNNILPWLASVTEENIIVGRSDTIPASFTQYYTFWLTIRADIWPKVVKSSLQVSGRGVWPATYEICDRKYYTDNSGNPLIGITLRGLDGSASSNDDYVFVRFLIEND